MQKYIKILSRLLGIFLVLGAIVAIAVLELKGIDMTKMRLFLTYWKQYITIIFAISSGLLLIAHSFKETR